MRAIFNSYYYNESIHSIPQCHLYIDHRPIRLKGTIILIFVNRTNFKWKITYILLIQVIPQPLINLLQIPTPPQELRKDFWMLSLVVLILWHVHYYDDDNPLSLNQFSVCPGRSIIFTYVILSISVALGLSYPALSPVRLLTEAFAHVCCPCEIESTYLTNNYIISTLCTLMAPQMVTRHG